MLKDLVLNNRSYRRFIQDSPISMELLKDLVDLARLTPSAGNFQPLKYMLCNDPGKNSQIFSTLLWAAYLKDWGGPIEGERPSAYIIILLDKKVRENTICDQGITAQTILLGAVEKGLGGCMIASVRRDLLSKILNLPEQYEVLLVLALGKPVEKVVLESVPSSGEIKYWRDDQGVHHVPKRSLEEIILEF